MKSHSPGADAALESLSGHLLYGFWLQILLLEALDRELGEETLILAPLTSAIVEDIEAETRVFYRPRQSSSDTTSGRDTVELGILDPVMTPIADHVGLQAVSLPYDVAAGPWSFSLRLLRSVEMVQGRHDRWTIAEHVLDRLHAGGLMTRVIRKGHDFRERLHSGLVELHSKRVANKETEELAHA